MAVIKIKEINPYLSDWSEDNGRQYIVDNYLTALTQLQSAIFYIYTVPFSNVLLDKKLTQIAIIHNFLSTSPGVRVS